jgi:hypothetical protein
MPYLVTFLCYFSNIVNCIYRSKFSGSNRFYRSNPPFSLTKHDLRLKLSNMGNVCPTQLMLHTDSYTTNGTYCFV